jgi:chemotaxis protein methyltransferase CheR
LLSEYLTLKRLPMKSMQLKANAKEFDLFSEYIEKKIGIKFPVAKKSLLESRFSGRIINLGLNSFSEYYEYLANNNDDEYDFFVDKITTHTTNFFREITHFNFLIEKGIDLINKTFDFPTIKIFSNGTSTGEEMYSISMIFSEQKKFNRINDYSVSGADISKFALLKAKEGIFKKDSIHQIPKKYRAYFIKNEDSIQARDILKNNMKFYVLNGCKKNQIFPDRYHIIFCRNMLIYFPNQMQQNIIDNLARILLPGGLIIIGLSETFQGINHGFKKIESTIYRSDEIKNGKD